MQPHRNGTPDELRYRLSSGLGGLLDSDEFRHRQPNGSYYSSLWADLRLNGCLIPFIGIIPVSLQLSRQILLCNRATTPPYRHTLLLHHSISWSDASHPVTGLHMEGPVSKIHITHIRPL